MRRLVGLAVCTAVAALIVMLAVASGNDRSGDPAPGKAHTEPSGHAAAPARAIGVVSARPAPGWTGEAVVDRATDDWEPAVAADPEGRHVYLLTTRYGGPRACRTCPSHQIMLLVSSDNGRSFGPDRFLCACPGVKGQNDPQVEVAEDGTVYAVWMNDYKPGVVFARSTDHGATWTRPLAVGARGMTFTDKPVLAVSRDGQDVYIAFNSSDSYVVASHDGGITFSAPVRTNRDGRYYFAGGGFVAPDGTATFGETSYTQSSTGPVRILVMRSLDGGVTWTQTEIDRVQQQPACVSRGCPPDFYGPQAALGGDVRGRLVIAYQGAVVPAGPQRMLVRRSPDGGATWSDRLQVGSAASGANAAFPALVGSGRGDFRLWFMDNANGPAGWNTWYRRSRDGGRTWSAVVRISDVVAGPSYVSAAGFAQPYGDYGEIAVLEGGDTFATWGEGVSYFGPGGVWYNRTR